MPLRLFWKTICGEPRVNNGLKFCLSADINFNQVKNESAVKRLIDGFLIKKGFNYRSRVEIRNEKFPTRVYEDLTLEAGYYDALIIELGEGKGDNWWCVVYPPLCFTGGENVKYRSKIYELINGLIG